MIQVRLSDKEFEQFEAIKESLKKKNNAATLREMIQLAPFVGKKTQAYVEKLSKVYNDLDAKADALIWNSSNVTKNLNEIAHAANIAKNNDPESFRKVYNDEFQRKAFRRYQQNTDMFEKMMSEPGYMEDFMTSMFKFIYDKLKNKE